MIAAGSVVKGSVPANTIYYNKRTEVVVDYKNKENEDATN